MKNKYVKISDLSNFNEEFEKDLAFEEWQISLTEEKIKNLELIRNSMLNLDIEALPFTKKEFNAFLSMTELVENIFKNKTDLFKSEISNLNEQLNCRKCDVSRQFQHIMKLQNDIFGLERKNKKLSEEKLMLTEKNNNYKKIICQLENKLRNLKLNNIETNNQT